MNEFLTEIYDAKKSGGDIRGIIGEYERMYKYVYIYSDPYVKEILANKDDPTLITDLVNATLGFTGCECITSPRIENPVVSGKPLYKVIEEDILLTQSRPDIDGKRQPGDRIGVEFQHVGGNFYYNRLLFYVARQVGDMLKDGEFYDKMENLNLISFQMFDYLPWKISKKYCHTVRFVDDEFNVFSTQQSITIVEVDKFLAHANTEYASDNSQLAQWLRAIDAINRNADFSGFVGDEKFARLQRMAELSRFSPEVFIKAGEHMKDDVEIAAYVAREEGREEGRAEERRKFFAERAALWAENRRLMALLAQKA